MNENNTQTTLQSEATSESPFANLNPAEIPTELHQYTFNGKYEKR